MPGCARLARLSFHRPDRLSHSHFSPIAHSLPGALSHLTHIENSALTTSKRKSFYCQTKSTEKLAALSIIRANAFFSDLLSYCPLINCMSLTESAIRLRYPATPALYPGRSGTHHELMAYCHSDSCSSTPILHRLLKHCCTRSR